jgi:formate dehydrogenase major subunit
VGTGIEADTDRLTAADSLLNLLLLTGSLGRRGTGLHLFRGLANEQGATDAGCVPDRLPGHRPVTDATARSVLADAWAADVPSSPGRTAHEMLAAFGKEVRAALVVGENPAVSKREREWVTERLSALDLLAVVELRPTATTALADVVLPAATSLESAGTVTNLDRLVQVRRPVLSPPASVRTDVEILRTIGGGLHGSGFDFADHRDVFDELRSVAPAYADLAIDDLADGGVRWPAAEPPILYRERFDTADGRAPLVPVEPPAVAAENPSAGLALVVGGRSGDRQAGTATDEILVHPRDASDRGLTSGDAVVVEGGEIAVEGSARVDGSVRPGSVFLHAALADPFVRAGRDRVTVRPASG